MQGSGYWINPSGKIFRLPSGKHIDVVIRYPN